MLAKTNLELKRWCNDFDAVRRVLQSLGAKLDRSTVQTDTFFQLPHQCGGPDGRMKLRQDGSKYLLIYYERPDFGAQDGAESLILLHEADEGLERLLARALGVKAVVRKLRQVWRKTNTVFHLDTVVNVGKIFEIELQKNGPIDEADRAVFAEYEEALLPYLGEVITGSNVDLVTAAKKQ